MISYRPGTWFGIVGERATVLLPPSEKARAGTLWALVDDGAGFDVRGIPAERLGVRRSIIERVVAVDGRADIETAPGAGTRIRLDWAPGAAS